MGTNERMTCNPCYVCRNLYEDSNLSTGLYGYGCDQEPEDWECGCGRPCPNFKPILSSEGLYRQLSDEAEAAWYEDEFEREADAE